MVTRDPQEAPSSGTMSGVVTCGPQEALSGGTRPGVVTSDHQEAPSGGDQWPSVGSVRWHQAGDGETESKTTVMSTRSPEMAFLGSGAQGRQRRQK